MKDNSINPLTAYYISVMFITGLLLIAFLHLSIVNEIKFFQNPNKGIVLISGFFIVLLMLPKKMKLSLGHLLTPVLKFLTEQNSKIGNFDSFELQVKNRKSNGPFVFLALFLVLFFFLFLILMLYNLK